MTTPTPGGWTPPPQPPRQKSWPRRHKVATVLLAIAGLVAAIVIAGIAAGPPATITSSSGHTVATAPSNSPSASPQDAAQQAFISDARDQFNVGSSVSDSDLGFVGNMICVDAHDGSSRLALDKVPAQNGLSVSGGGANDLVNLAIQDLCPGYAPKPTWHVIARFSGSGEGNSAPFKLIGSQPEIKVSYSYSGNGSFGSADNFIADMVSPDDDQSIANTIRFSGDKTTRLYPDMSFGGSHRYHLEVTATGSWSFVVREKF